MTREEIRLTLAAIGGEGLSDGPPASASSRRLAAVVEDQERRLADLDRRMRVLEPCTRRSARAEGMPHIFVDLGRVSTGDGRGSEPGGVLCQFCGVSR